MSRKFSDLANEDKKIIEDELEAVSAQLGMDSWESHGVNDSRILQDQIGMCYNCKNLSYCKTEFGTVFAKCEEFKFKLSGQNRITECNLHSPKNVMTLNEMYAIATLIDPAEAKTEGFISSNPKLRPKKKPSSGPGSP